MITLSKLIEEAYKLEESPHKDNPLLSKLLPRNQQNRQMFAEKLKFLRQARDKARIAGKTYKANAVDNVARSLTNAPVNDPTLKTMISKPLNELPEKNNLFTYLPKQTKLPINRLNKLKNRIDLEQQNPQLFQNKLSNYLDKNDITTYQQQLKKLNNKTSVNDNVFEMFKYQPRLAGVKREINPLLYYNQSKNSLKFY